MECVSLHTSRIVGSLLLESKRTSATAEGGVHSRPLAIFLRNSIAPILRRPNTPSLQYSVSRFPRAFTPCLPALNRQSSALGRKGLMRHGSVLSLPVLQPVMKTRKVPRECSPSLLSGKRRWRLFHWISRRTQRGGAKNNYLSQVARSA